MINIKVFSLHNCSLNNYLKFNSSRMQNKKIFKNKTIQQTYFISLKQTKNKEKMFSLS